MVAQARSLWYDTGSRDPNYTNFIVTPPVASQPARHQLDLDPRRNRHVESWPGNERRGGVYINAAGVVNPNVLISTTQGIGMKRYFRFKVEFRNNNLTNSTPSYSNVVMAYTIP